MKTNSKQSLFTGLKYEKEELTTSHAHRHKILPQRTPHHAIGQFVIDTHRYIQKKKITETDRRKRKKKKKKTNNNNKSNPNPAHYLLSSPAPASTSAHTNKENENSEAINSLARWSGKRAMDCKVSSPKMNNSPPLLLLVDVRDW
jgi:hypothetical protein